MPQGRSFFGWLAWFASAALATGCAAALHRTPDGNYKVDGPNYQIAALPDGRLMPAGWLLKNYEERDGNFARTDRYERQDLRFSRDVDDGRLRIGPGDTEPCNWVSTPVHCWYGPTNELPSANGVTLAFNPRGLAFAVRSTRQRQMSGGEGVETIIDAVAPASGEVIERSYQFWFHDRAGEHFALLVFTSPAASFVAAVNDVSSLVQRISFP